jgi:hypothetical protein
MSNGRKIFGFLKFIEDLKKFSTYLYESSFNKLGILKAFNCLASCFYHFLDSLVWASNVGIINPIFTGEIKWKTSKNFFSLIKTLIKFTTNMMDFKTCYYQSKLNENETQDDYDCLNKTIKSRSKLRMKMLGLVRSVLKIITQLYSLKFRPISSNLHPINVALCGILHCILSLLKNYLKTYDNHLKVLQNTTNKPNMKSEVILRRGITPMKSRTFIRRNSDSFELSLLERHPNKRILNDIQYFDNYYIDFNKDIALEPDKIIKASIGKNFEY